MKRPSFNAVAVHNARRDPQARTLEVNLVDAKGNSQNLVLGNDAVTQLLGAVFQKRIEDPTKDFFIDESIPIGGITTFRLASGHTGLRLHLAPLEVFDISFEPAFQPELQRAFRYLADNSAGAAA